jgi:hypothetical protein
MSTTPDSPSFILGDALALALDRATGSSLASLRNLHEAVRSYTSHQRSRGVPLDDIIRAVSSALMALEDERMRDLAETAWRDPKLATQLRAWCSEAYFEKAPGTA